MDVLVDSYTSEIQKDVMEFTTKLVASGMAEESSTRPLRELSTGSSIGGI
jgi:hypothetical protein